MTFCFNGTEVRELGTDATLCGFHGVGVTDTVSRFRDFYDVSDLFRH